MTGLTIRHIGLEDPAERPGGLNRYLADLVAAQLDASLDAEAIVLGGSEGSPSRGMRWAGPKSASIVGRLRSMRRVAVRRPRPDVVDAHFALYAIAAIAPIVGGLRRRPLVVHFQGPWADESVAEGGQGVNVRVKRAIERAVYRRADAVVVLSRAFEELVVDRYGVDPSRVHRIPPGVDTTRFSPGDRADARGRLGLGSDTPFVAVAVRRLRSRMGLEVAIEAFSRSAIPGAILVIVGEGPERERLEALAAELGAPVRFVGRVDDATLVDWYRAADVSVVPSVALEGFGLVVLESLACGTPVIASDLEGLRDALDGLEGAQLVAPGSVDELVHAVVRAATGATATAEQCREHAERHGWPEVVRRHSQLYRQVLERPALTVFLGHSAALSGGELALARLAPALLRERDVLVLLAEEGPLVDRLRGSGVPVEVLAMDERARSMGREAVGRGPAQLRQALVALGYSLRLARRLRTLSPDQVHTNSLKAALYGGVAARLARVPLVVWHVRDRIADDYLPARAVWIVRTLARWIPDAVVANSAATLATVGPIDVPTLVLPSPLDPSIHPPVERRPERALRIGVLGRLAPWKGQDLFVAAFEQALAGGGATAQIIGAPLFGEEGFATLVHQQIEDLDLGEQVEMVGFVEDVAAALAEVDVLVHTSRLAEPFGQVVVEGMGAGCCVIAADAGGPAEIITDGVDGLLYEMGSVASLADALRTVSADPELLARLGSAAVRTAAAYRPELLAGELVAFYEAVGRRR